MSYTSEGTSTIVVKHSDGGVTPYNATNVDTDRGSSLLTALAASVSGDVVQLGPGIFDCGTSRVVIPAGVGVIGAGWNTEIRTAYTLSVTAPFLLNNGSFLQDVYLHETLVDSAGSTKQQGFTVASNATATMRNVRFVGDSDGQYFNQTVNATLYLYDCSIETCYDAGQNLGATNCTVIAYNTLFQAYYGASASATQRAISGVSTYFKLYNCRIVAVNNSPDGTNNIAVKGFTGNCGELHNCSFYTACLTSSPGSSSSPVVYDIEFSGAGANLIIDNCTGSGKNGALVLGTATNGVVRGNGNVVVPCAMTAMNAATSVTGTAGYSATSASNHPFTVGGYTHAIKVYAYKTIAGVRVYSAAATGTFTDDNAPAANHYFYNVSWSWTASTDPAVEGYIVTFYSNDPTYSYNYDRYKQTSTASISDNNTSLVAPVPLMDANNTVMKLSGVVQYPSMTSTSRGLITTPAAGMTIFNSTTGKLECYDGSAWQVCW